MNRIHTLLKRFRWWELAFMAAAYIAVVVLSIVFKSNWLIVLSSLFGMTTTFLLAKGFALGNLVGILQIVFYTIMCYNNRYFGEIITNVGIVFPAYAFSFYTWTKRNHDHVLQVNNSIKLQEWLLAFVGIGGVAVGFYFVLRALNTANLIFSTLAVFFVTMYCYLSIRRSQFCFVFRLLMDLVTFVLWLLVFLDTLKEGFGAIYIPTLLNYVVYAVLDLFGIVNWIRLKRTQNFLQEEHDIKEE